jgi:hypothetical protein
VHSLSTQSLLSEWIAPVPSMLLAVAVCKTFRHPDKKYEYMG